MLLCTRHEEEKDVDGEEEMWSGGGMGRGNRSNL